MKPYPRLSSPQTQIPMSDTDNMLWLLNPQIVNTASDANRLTSGF